MRTNVGCTTGASWRGVAVYVGEPGLDVETKAPALTSTSCDASGQVGSLVVVPTGSDSGRVGIRVVAGLTRNPEDCASVDYDGCIVARRSLTYLPHQEQTVVIDLTVDCAGNPCDINHTCVDGSCTDTVTATAPVADDGGVLVSEPTVRCGDDGTRCPANDPDLACCITRNTDGTTLNLGTCIPAKECPPANAVLYCDDSSECPLGDAGVAQICCELLTSSGTYLSLCSETANCPDGVGNQFVLCEERLSCPSSGANCRVDTRLNGYFDCSN